MIISHKYKFIFIHVHKCAGTAISKSLLPYLGEDDEIYGIYGIGDSHEISEANRIKNVKSNKKENRHGPHNGLPWKHSFAKDVKQYVGEDIWNEYCKFSFIRNPFAIYVSLFHWTKQKKNPKWPGGKRAQKLIKASKDFKSFIKENYLENKLWGQTLCDYVCDDDGNVIVDFVGRFENLGFDLGYICAKLDLPRLKLLKKNWSKHNYYPEYYDEESEQIIRRNHTEDLKKFNYSFLKYDLNEEKLKK